MTVAAVGVLKARSSMEENHSMQMTKMDLSQQLEQLQLHMQRMRKLRDPLQGLVQCQ